MSGDLQFAPDRWETAVVAVDTDSGTCAPPDEGGGWEPIGSDGNIVVWRRRLFSAESLDFSVSRADLYEDLLEHVAEREAEARRALSSALGWAAELEAEIEELQKLRSNAPPTGSDRNRTYMRGYNTGRAKGRKDALRDLEIEARLSGWCLHGIG